MRIIILSILLALILPAFGQAPKRANCISIKADSISLKKLSIILIDNGYSIDNANNELQIINTGFKDIKLSSVKLNFSIRKNEVIVSGRLKNDLGETKIENKGMKGSPIMNAWEEMNNIAKLIPNTGITYLIK